MAIPFVCSECGKHLRAPDHLAGRKARCSACGGVIRVPPAPDRAAELPLVVQDAEAMPAAPQERSQTRAREPLPATKRPDDLSGDVALFALLGDETRLGILLVLAGGQQNVTALCKRLGLKQPTMSHHLGMLRMRGVVAARRQGKSVVYELNREALRRVRSLVDRLT